ncbi:MAG: D-2-hydroxyacid dehydrogenase [Actinomycetales bacterium]
MRQPPVDGPVVIGILYPPEWFGEADGFAAACGDIEAVDPRLEVVVVTYEEGQHLRTLRGSDANLTEARAAAPELTDAQRKMFARVHAVIAIDLPFDVAAIAPNLSWVQGIGAGSTQLQSAGLAAAGIRLTSSAGTNAVGIAEFVIGRLLEERKHFRALAALQAAHDWSPIYGTQLAGTTVGLIGFGAINSAVAARLRAFDVTVLVTRRRARPGDRIDGVDAVFPPERLHEMLSRCATVIAAVPESPETTGLMDEQSFAAMPAGSFFVNVGRGSLVEESALLAALASGHLRGAALDVASTEPLPADDPLWTAPNLALSFHCSASPTAMFDNLQRLVLDNVRRWLANEPLRNEVTGD